MITLARSLWLMRTAVVLLIPLSESFAQTADLDTRLVLSTFKLTGEVSGTAFVLTQPSSVEGKPPRLVLVTAEHIFSGAKREDQVTVHYRKRGEDGSWSKAPAPLKIKNQGKPLWTKHPSLDIAVMVIQPPDDVYLPGVSWDLLATDETLARLEVHPGDSARVVGFPHPPVFEFGEGNCPVVRRGCIASYPLLPTRKTKTFVVDSNAFEGDSGSAVYLATERRPSSEKPVAKPDELILGLMVGHYYLDEEYKAVYQTTKLHQRMGLGVAIHASAVREAIELLGPPSP